MFIFYFPILLILFFVFLFFVFKKRKRDRLKCSLDMSLFSVKLPRHEDYGKDQKKDKKAAILEMEQIYSNFLYLDRGEGFLKKFFSGYPRIAFEIASEIGEGDISFYIAAPSSYENSLNKYVQGVYSGAILEKIKDDYTIFEPNGKVSASFLKLKETFFLPINSYQDLERDPLEAIVNSVSDITPDEGSAIQLIIRPTSFNLREKGEEVLSQVIKEKKKLKDAISYVNADLLSRILRGFSVDSQKKDKNNNPQEVGDKKVDDTIIEAIRAKIKKPAFEVNIRLVGVAEKKERSQEILYNLESSFSQFSSGFNGFKSIRIKRKKKLRKFIYDFSFRNFNKKRISVLNSEELSSLFHLPLSHIESPRIKWAKAKEAPPPSELPQTGAVLIGKTAYRGEDQDVYIPSEEDRRRHFYVIGQTGTGKTSLLKEMIRQDIENGKGVGVIDPHGDLIEHTLANIPQERIDDVVLFEPFDTARPFGLNMLEWDTPEQRDFAISEMITIFTHLFPPEIIGPMFEHYMRNAMLALSADKNDIGTIIEIPSMYTNEQFAEEKIKKVTDPLVRNFWIKEWRQTTGQTRSDMLGYVVSKLGRFIENEMMRNILGQSKSSFNLEELMNNKKIFLANLSKGLTGEVNSSLLGLIMVSKMQAAAFRRTRIPEEQRNDFYLYIDEFQNFTTDSVATILSEARKYRLNLILAHQYMPQLKEEIKNAVIGNAGTIASYRVGISDAEFLENQFSPEFSKFDLSNIDNFQYVVKMMLRGNISSPFKVKAIKPIQKDYRNVEAIKNISRTKYGRSKVLVEEEISRKLKIDI